MSIFDLYSKKQKRLRGEVPEIYKYEELPQELKVQIVHIWMDSLGNDDQYFGYSDSVKEAYRFIVETLCREYGIFKLPSADKYGDRLYLQELANYFLQVEDTERALDIIDLSFKVINNHTCNYQYLNRSNSKEIADNAISELNERFKEHGIGFQFVENEIIRIDSELLYTETVKPALRLLHQQKYSGAQQEFLSAYDHYRHKKYKEALNDCLKSLESTMKAICDCQKWSYPNNATAKKLIQVCFDNNLIPTFWQQHFSSLRSMLESSIPTGRNKLSGHGQGSKSISVPDYLVSYMLHMTASTLVFLALAEENLA